MVEIPAEEAGPHKVDLFLRNKEIPTHIEHVKDFPKTIVVEPGVDAKKSVVKVTRKNILFVCFLLV